MRTRTRTRTMPTGRRRESGASASTSASAASSDSAATEGSVDRRQELLAIQASFVRDCMPLKDGAEVRIRPMAPGDVKALTDVMSSAFRGTPDERPRARVAKYLLDQLEPNPEEVCLVALIDVNQAAAAAAANAVSVEAEADGDGEESEGRPIAIVSLTFAQEARGSRAAASSSRARSSSGAGSIPPPPDAAYLCNMAVSDVHRGRGAAKALLRACDELVREMGGCDIWLHVRVKDDAAMGLYEGAGYRVTARENAVARLFSKDGGGVALLRKELVPRGVNAFFT